jgi:Leucine-rich repeat (LRR) protein
VVLFQTPTKNVMLYTMHDLVHDLARSVVGDELIVIDAAKKGKTSVQKYYRYDLLINYVGQTKLSNILSKKVRSLHFSSSSKVGPRDHSFSFAKRLSILDFSECSSIPLPPSIGQLKQLKCLIAPKLQNTSLPEAIVELSKLQYLNLCGSSLISTLPESIGKLSCLMHLDLSGCSGISKVSESFGGLKSLVHLDMSNCFGITSLVGSIGNLEKLRYLDLSGCYGILEVSESFDGLKSLVHFDMSYCSGITSLPGSLGNLKKLRHLDLSRCSGVKDVPDSLTCLKELQYLNLSHSSITRLPEDIGSLTNLQYLSLKWCDKITELAMSLQNLQNLVHLDLSRCTCVEGSLEALRGVTSLGYLDMSRFTWNALPECIGNLKNLRALKLKFCMNLGSLPEWIGNLTNLHTLVLRGCLDLKSLPECIGNLTNLHTLDLKRCWDLKSLPECIGNLKNLHTLDLSGCSKLRSLRDSIGEITVLKSILIEGCSNELIDQVNSKLHCSLALPNFWVRVDVVSGCSNLPLLESINVGELRILCLENVRSMEEACKVKLLDKDKLSDLTLAWSDLDVADRFVDDEDLLRQLEPPRGLESLCLEGYSRQTFPRWFMDISHHLPNLVSIVLETVTIHDYLPPLGQLPNLAKLRLKNCYRVTKIDKDFCGGKGAFPGLSYFKLDHMYGLEEWSTTYSFEDGDVESSCSLC